MSNNRFPTFAWSLLGYNILVIVWGAFVRATGSGAGCGSHWPLCNGEVIPRGATMETLIEFSHRITSGLALVGVVVLLVWALRAYPRGSLVRRGAQFSMFFMVAEALIGAGLVLLQYVASNVSVARAFWMAGHLTNTFFLLAALTVTAWWSSGWATRANLQRLQFRGHGLPGTALAASIIAVLFLGISGAITALGDTLVLTAGISPEDSPIVATLVELRIFHPLIAFAVGGVLLAAAWVVTQRQPGPLTRRLALGMVGLYTVQLAFGALNVWLRAPVWLQLLHLFLTDLIWINLVVLTAVSLARPVAERAAAKGLPMPSRV